MLTGVPSIVFKCFALTVSSDQLAWVTKAGNQIDLFVLVTGESSALYLLCESCSAPRMVARGWVPPALTAPRLMRPRGSVTQGFLPRPRIAIADSVPPSPLPWVGGAPPRPCREKVLHCFLKSWGALFRRVPKERATCCPHAPRLLAVDAGLPALPADP